MAQGQRVDPYRNFKFRVEIDGLTVAGFSECDIPAATVEVIEYREGSEEVTPRKLPGLVKYSNITLKRGVTNTKEFFQWFRLVVQGKISQARRNMSIALLDDEGNEVARWKFRNAWPTKYEGPKLNARTSEVAIETLEITHEGLDLE